MSWVYFSLIQVFLSAGMAETNRRLKLDSIRLNFWRTLLLSAIFAVPASYVPWPTANGFYAAALLTGIASAVASIVMFSMAATFNGRVALLQVPVTTMMMFVAWLPFDTHLHSMMHTTPLRAAGIGGCLVAACLCMVAMQRQSVGANVLRRLIPVGLIATASGIAGKLALEADEGMVDNIIVISFLIMVIQALVSGLLMMRMRHNHTCKGEAYPLFPPHMLKGTLVMAFWGGVSCYISWFAIGYAPNPAYPNAIFLLTPVLMLFYHKLWGIEDRASPLAGSLLALCIAALVLLSAS